MLKNVGNLLLLVSGFVAASAHAIDPPRLGMTYNTKENSSIAFDCKPVSQTEIECSLNQTAVRKAATPADLVQRITQARGEYKKGSRIDDATCKLADQLIPIFEGKALLVGDN